MDAITRAAMHILIITNPNGEYREMYSNLKQAETRKLELTAQGDVVEIKETDK